MHYTIMTLTANNMTLNLSKNGNQYTVYFTCENGKDGQTRHETYKTIDEAVARFQIGVGLIGKSFGNFWYKSYQIFS